MINEFQSVIEGLSSLIEEWEPKLSALSNDVISERRNSHNRSVKQIIGHMIDSASNNTHRTVHMHYQPSPLIFPNYATEGNNDRWIAIQNYQDEDWNDLIMLWKYSNLHFIHIVKNVDPGKLENQWECGNDCLVSMKDCIIDYLRHFKLHLNEINELIEKNSNNFH